MLKTLKRFLLRIIFQLALIYGCTSGGGSVDAAHSMAKLIRSNGFDTAVNGKCLSACTDMFLGGNNRHLVGEGN